jgi:hypothetical protein
LTSSSAWLNHLVLIHPKGLFPLNLTPFTNFQLRLL